MKGLHVNKQVVYEQKKQNTEGSDIKFKKRKNLMYMSV